MKVLIEIGHPGNVHYFRNIIELLNKNGHSTVVVARKTIVIDNLLKSLNLNYYSRGKGANSFFGKLLYLLYVNLLMIKIFYKEKPKIYLSFGSPYGLFASFIFKFYSIMLDDTEVGKYEQLVYMRYADVILTPSAFTKDLGKKQLRFHGFMEMCYLLPKYFNPNQDVLRMIGLNDSEPYAVIRSVAWNASHDYGQKGLTKNDIRELIKTLEKFNIKVFISSENIINPEFKKYELNIPSHYFHDILSFAKIYIGEGATTASECIVLGTTAIYINSINAGTLIEQEKSGYFYNFRSYDGVNNRLVELLVSGDYKNSKKLRDEFFIDKIDVTSFLYWFITNYPESHYQFLLNSQLQYSFK